MRWLLIAYIFFLELYCLVAQIQQAETLFQFFNKQSFVFFAGNDFLSLALLQFVILCSLKAAVLVVCQCFTSLLLGWGVLIGAMWTLLLVSFTDFTSVTFLDTTLPLYIPQFNTWLWEFYVYAFHCCIFGFLMYRFQKHPKYWFRLFLMSYIVVLTTYYVSGLLVASLLVCYFCCEVLGLLQEIQRASASRNL